MKLYLQLCSSNIERITTIAHASQKLVYTYSVPPYALQAHGIEILSQVRTLFPESSLIADTKIAHYPKESISLLEKYKPEYITVLGGSGRATIHKACQQAQKLGIEVILDLVDAKSPGEIALEAQSLGVKAILMNIHDDENEQSGLKDRWEMIAGNTRLPIILNGSFNSKTVSLVKQFPAYALLLETDQLPETQEEITQELIAIKDIIG